MAVKQLTVVSDLTHGPSDMGERVVARSLVEALRALIPVHVVVVGRTGWRSRSMLDARVITSVRSSGSQDILYMPASSLTLASALRARVLQTFSRARVTVVSLQPRHHSREWLFQLLLHGMSVIVTSPRSAERLSHQLRVGVLPPAIDTERFTPAVEPRANGPIGDLRPIILHVGHLSKSRGLSAVAAVARNPKLRMVVVASSSTVHDADVQREMSAAGVEIVSEFVEHIEDIYRSATVYVFPVSDDQGCIETPMSVLEALACDVPVVTTRFGSLPEVFEATAALRFVDDPSLIPSVVQTMVKDRPSGARALVQGMTWQNAALCLLAFMDRTEGDS